MPVGARIFLGEKLTIFNLIGIVISFSGVLLVILGKNLQFVASPSGILLLMIAVFMAVGFTLLVKRLSARYNAFTLTVWQNIIGVFFFLPLFIIFGKGDLNELLSDPNIYMPVLYLGVLGSAIAFIFFNQGIKFLGATRAESFTYLIPVLTAVFAYYILKETLNLQKVLGIFVVLAGVLMTQIRIPKRFGSKGIVY
jgi:drug/metabolite transporter (DMT)-like permease